MDRLDQRLPDLDEATRAEVQLRRAPDRREAAAHAHRAGQGARRRGPGRATTPQALRELFDLDPRRRRRRVGRRRTASRGGRRRDRALRLGTRRSTLATTQSHLGGRPAARPRPRRRARRDHHRGRPSTARRWPRSAAPASSPPPSAQALLDGRDRPRRALAQGPADRARARPGRRRRPGREDPRDALVARDGLTLGELPAGSVVGTGSPRRAAQLAALGLGLRVKADPRQRRHPAAAASATAPSTPSCWPVPAWPASAGSTRSPRLSTRSRCCPPPGRAPSRSSAAPTDADVRRRRRRRSTTPTPGPASTAERALLAALEAGCTAPGRRARRGRRGRRRASSCRCAPSSAPSTAPSTCAARSSGRCRRRRAPRPPARRACCSRTAPPSYHLRGAPTRAAPAGWTPDPAEASRDSPPLAAPTETRPEPTATERAS